MSRYSALNLFCVTDFLLEDNQDLEQKGYGCMLKAVSQKEPQQVICYLNANHTVMPRVTFRYAIEKLDDKTKR